MPTKLFTRYWMFSGEQVHCMKQHVAQDKKSLLSGSNGRVVQYLRELGQVGDVARQKVPASSKEAFTTQLLQPVRE